MSKLSVDAKKVETIPQKPLDEAIKAMNTFLKAEKETPIKFSHVYFILNENKKYFSHSVCV